MREPFVACAHADKCSAFTTMCIIENAPNPASKHRACRLGSHQLLGLRSRHLALRSRRARILSQTQKMPNLILNFHSTSPSSSVCCTQWNADIYRVTTVLHSGMSRGEEHSYPPRAHEVRTRAHNLRTSPNRTILQVKVLTQKEGRHAHPEESHHRHPEEPRRGHSPQPLRGCRIPPAAQLAPRQGKLCQGCSR